MFKSVEIEGGKETQKGQGRFGKTGSVSCPGVHNVSIDKSSWRTGALPWKGELLTFVD